MAANDLSTCLNITFAFIKEEINHEFILLDPGTFPQKTSITMRTNNKTDNDFFNTDEKIGCNQIRAVWFYRRRLPEVSSKLSEEYKQFASNE
jgi:hypothetical protein